MSKSKRPQTTLLYVTANPPRDSPVAAEELRRIQAIDSLHVVPLFAVSPVELVQFVFQHKPTILHYGRDDTKDSWLTIPIPGVIISGPEPPAPKPGGAIEPNNLQEMQRILRDQVRLVVLMNNASSSHAREIAKAGMYVVGVKEAVSDEEALAFSDSFYIALTSDYSLENAMARAMLETSSPDDFFLLCPDNAAASEVFFPSPKRPSDSEASGIQISTESDTFRKKPAAEPARESTFALGWQRDATDDETALNVEEVANALVATLDSTDGEVCFGLFGHWGRGKTHLMRRVARLMPGRYEVVWFSAWKYPNVPQVWVHLYETLAERAYERAVVPRLVRGNLHRRGIWPLLGQLTLAGLLMIPLSKWLALLWTLATVLGVWGLLSMVKVARAVIAPARRLEATYLGHVSHGDKLGLQETIGKDLRALLAGWLNWQRSWKFTLKHALIYALALGLVAVGIHIGLRNVQADSPIQPWMAVALWLALGVIAALWIWLYGRSAQRVLLIVDDLDRCEPAHMSTVIESLKLLVEDQALQGRVQVVALVEEETLRWAIERRFKARVADLPEAERAPELERLIAEHLQKLFIGHMRLPPALACPRPHPRAAARIDRCAAARQRRRHAEPGRATNPARDHRHGATMAHTARRTVTPMQSPALPASYG